MGPRAWALLRGRAARRAARFLRRDATAGDDDGPLLDEDVLRQLQRFSLTGSRALTDWLLGEHPGRRKTQALEFADYRGYVPGDDLRLIDWNAYARLDELFVKTSRTEEVITLSLLIDCSRSMDWGRPNKLRYGKRLAALLGALALLQSDSVRLFALGDGGALPGALLHGPSALQALAAELETLPLAASTDLRESLYAARQLAGLSGVAVVISDFWAPLDRGEILAALAAEGTVATALHVVDPAEARPGVSGPVALRDRESGDQVLLTITPALRRRYVERFTAHARALAEYCAALEIRYLQVQTDAPPLDLLIEALREERAGSV